MHIKAVMVSALMLACFEAQAQNGAVDAQQKQLDAATKQRLAQSAQEQAQQSRMKCELAQKKAELAKGTRKGKTASAEADEICGNYQLEQMMADQYANEARVAALEAQAALYSMQVAYPPQGYGQPQLQPMAQPVYPQPVYPQPVAQQASPQPVAIPAPQPFSPVPPEFRSAHPFMVPPVHFKAPKTTRGEKLEAYAGEVASQLRQMEQQLQTVDQMTKTVGEMALRAKGQENEAAVRSAAITAYAQLQVVQAQVQQYRDEAKRAAEAAKEAEGDSSEAFWE